MKTQTRTGNRAARNLYGPAMEYNGLIWVPMHPGATFEMLGYIPTFLNASNPLLAAQQIDRNYGHGGGWTPFNGFTLLENGDLKYPGDPRISTLWATKLRTEFIRFYQFQWLRITQPDGTWQVCRLD